MIRVGVIGVGSMGKNHVRIYSEMEDVELVAISDVNKALVDELSHTFKTVPYYDYKELLKQNLDAVSIVVPTKMHKMVALDALNAGINVLVEKPIADTLENAEEMIKTAKKKNLTFMVGHIERFNPAIIKLKEIIESGQLGEVVSISTRRVGPYSPRIRDVGVILDIGVHDIDVISYLYGKKIDQVYTIAGANIHSSEDHASIHLRFDHDFSGLVDVNWLTPHKTRTLTAVGVGGVAYLDYVKQSLVLHDKEWVREAKIDQKEPLLNELEHFIKWVSNKEKPHPNGEEGKHALEACLAAITSYKEERVIDI